jgi:hypothetical protein
VTGVIDSTPTVVELGTRPQGVPAAPDPFDLDSLRLTQDAAATLGVKKAVLSIPARKPDKSWFVRTRKDYCLQTAVIELKEERETYLVAPSLWPSLAGESTFSPRVLFAAMNRQGVLFVWPVRLPGQDGKIDEWSRTSLEAAELATNRWVRVTANMTLGAYDVFEATGQLPEPNWPELSFNEIIRVAFRDRFIDSPAHAVLKRLRGEV